MLVSGSSLHKIKGHRNSSFLRINQDSAAPRVRGNVFRNGNFIKYNSLTSLLAYKSTYQNLFNVNKMINKKQEDYKKTTKGSFLNSHNFKKNFNNSFNLVLHSHFKGANKRAVVKFLSQGGDMPSVNLFK
jgi:hypothetical protein